MNIFNMLFSLYLANILLGIFCFLICNYFLKKYLKIDMIKIINESFKSIKKFFTNGN